MSKNLSQSSSALQSIQNSSQNEIILYRPNDAISLEVRLENETVWLNRQQIAELFGRDIKTIGKHINNALKEELANFLVVANFATTKKYGRREGFTQIVEVEYYNLDVILSVGYRVKSKQGVLFRQWANKVLKEYLLRGYAVNQRINQLEDKVDRRFADYDQKIEHLNQQVDFFVKTSLPPKEKVFFDGQLFDAHILMSRLVESAEKRIVLIDNYIDESVLTLLLKRKRNVEATVYTMQMSSAFKLDLQKHNKQYSPVAVNIYTKAHDRF
ncbi:MAG: virulence RhuM family protein, partial [Paludibacteraceae bacterium]|nr:virulence RhuM family protein [Paludibacteraceae bacterium]